MNTFVLIHGSWVGPHYWEIVKENLEKANYAVINIELPGYRCTTTEDLAEITLDHNRDYIIERLQDIPGDIILVGHSAGGMVISAVAELISQKVKTLVYVAAFLPANGQSLLELLKQDEDSLINTKGYPSSDNLSLLLKEEDISEIFLRDCPEHIAAFISNYRPEPIIPNTMPVLLTSENFGSIPKVYVYATQDKAITLFSQQQMVAAANVTKTYSLDCEHIIPLSKPDELTQLLATIASEAVRA